MLDRYSRRCLLRVPLAYAAELGIQHHHATWHEQHTDDLASWQDAWRYDLDSYLRSRTRLTRLHIGSSAINGLYMNRPGEIEVNAWQTMLGDMDGADNWS